MDDQHGPKLKRRRLDPSSLGADTHTLDQQEPHSALARPSASNHVYPVIHLAGNSQAIFGNVGNFSSFFRNNGEEVSKRLLLNALYFEGMQSRREQIAARAGSPKYVEWVWTTNFSTWLQSSESFYWITGCPGSGKSTLMKHISESRKTMDTLQANGEKWTIMHFFFDFRAKIGPANTIDGMLRSLLYQIIKRLPEVAKHLDLKFIENHPEGGFRDYMDNLCDAIKQASTRICAFIDGLDEFAGTGSDLLEAIHSLEDRSGIKICMASRPYPIFTEHLSDYQHLVMQDHNYHSIQLYTEAQFKSHRIVGVTNLPRQLSDKIRIKARGVFLWARLATDELLRDLLAGRSLAELELHLTQMPQEVEEMYQRILDRLPKLHKIEAALLLYILTASEQSVEVRKLFIAMKAVSSKLYTSGTAQLVDEDCDSDSDSRLLALLGDFVDIHTSKDEICIFTYGRTGLRIRSGRKPVSHARLTHETLYAYLTSNKWLQDIVNPHLTITDRSRFWFNLYLDELLDCLEGSETLLSSRVLVKYRTCIEKLSGRHNKIGTENDHDLDDTCSTNCETENEGQETLNMLEYDTSGKVQDEVVVLLELWKQWTPLLPYALQEIFSFDHIFAKDSRVRRINDLQRILQSPIAWLHKLTCVFEGFESPKLFRPCCGALDRYGLPTRTKHLLADTDPSVSIPLRHEMCTYLAQFHCESLATRQFIFDVISYEYFLPTYVTVERLDVDAYPDSGRGEWHLILNLLKSCRDIQTVISRHRPECKFHQSLTPEVGFLCHWANAIGPVSSTDMVLTALFEVLSIDQEYLNQIADPVGEPLLNVILEGINSTMLKTVLTLRAGANPYVAGRSGTAFDMAKAGMEHIRKFKSKPGLGRNARLLEGEKISELLDYYATHNGRLPQNLDEYLKFNV